MKITCNQIQMKSVSLRSSKIATWMIEVIKGQEAQMKILNYLLDGGGSVDDVRKSSGDEETPSTELHLGVELERIPDGQQLPEQTSNEREKSSVEVSKSSEQKLQGEPTFYNSPHLRVDSKSITENRNERNAMSHGKPSSDVPKQLASLHWDGKDNQFIGLNNADNSKKRIASSYVRKQLASIQSDGQDDTLIGLNSGRRYSRSSKEYKNYFKLGYML